MIDPITTVLGSSLGGAIIGVVSNVIKERGKNQVELERIRFGREQNVQDYQTKLYSMHPPFRLIVFLLAFTYCLCVAICFLCGDLPVASQSFNSKPSSFSIGWGFIEKQTPDRTVYLLTFAGLGTYFLSPISFILTSVLTGIVPKRGI